MLFRTGSLESFGKGDPSDRLMDFHFNVKNNFSPTSPFFDGNDKK
jgi:hypothetical protein